MSLYIYVLKITFYETMTDSIKIKQSWDGIVVECTDQIITARLKDLTHPKNPDELVTIPYDKIAESEHALIQEGAIFTWIIWYKINKDKSRKSYSKITFRQLPKWSEKEIDDAKNLAQKYIDFFELKSNESTKKAP